MIPKLFVLLTTLAALATIPMATAVTGDWPGTEALCLNTSSGQACPPDYRPIVVPVVADVYTRAMGALATVNEWREFAEDSPSEVLRFTETGCMRSPPVNDARELCMLA